MSIGLIGLALAYLLFSGTVPLTVGDVGQALLWNGSELAESVVWQLRLPRLIAGILAGFGLGIVGAVFQVMLRNPLAEPYILGVASGAGVGGTLALVVGLGAVGGGIGLTLGGMAGSLGALGLVFALAGWGKKQDVLRLLLSGVVVGSMLAAMTSLILIFGGKDTNVILRWLLGSLTPMSWERLAAMVVVIGSAFFLAWRRSRWLNAFGLSEELAGRLGVDARREMMVQVGAGSLAVGAIVGSAGIIGFIGLIAPHVARVWVGGDLRRSLVLSGLVGSGLLVLADLLAQKLWLGAELPVGSVTAVLGSPVLLWLLRRGVYRV